jgi:N-acyl-D-aspartate/D-glutamate deacylase
VDIHTHSDLSLIADPSAPSKVMQGVTTEVVGNCGFSAFPAHPRRSGLLREFLRGLGTSAVDVDWTDLDGYADQFEAASPIMNIAALVGHGSLRIAASGLGDVSMTADVLEKMDELLERALGQGAFGLSTGLSYVPSRFAGSDEIHRLAATVAAHDGLYATHARAHLDSLTMVDEAIEVGRVTGVRTQFSHIALNDPTRWGEAETLISRFVTAVDTGVDVRYDVYPYAASASSLTQYLPGWLQEAGEEGIREMLGSTHVRRRARTELKQGLYGTAPWMWDRVLIATAGPGDDDLEGLNVAEASELRCSTPEDAVLDLCGRHGNSVQVILFYRHEADVSEFLAHPLSMLGSDGSALPVATPGRPHPRHFGAHARLLRKYVAETRTLTLEDAVYKATGAPARQLGIVDRGVLKVGARADIAVFDLRTVRDRATWTAPQQLASGVRDVWVNGVRTVAAGKLTGDRAGRLLRRSRAC